MSKWNAFKQALGLRPGNPEPVLPPVPKLKFNIEQTNSVRVYLDLTVQYTGEGRLSPGNAQKLGEQYGKLMLKEAQKVTNEVKELRIVATNVDVTPEPEL